MEVLRLRLEATRAARDPGRFERLDRVLVDLLRLEGRSCSRSQLARSFDAGEVRVSGQVAKPSRLVDGVLDVEIFLGSLDGRLKYSLRPEPIPLSIVFEDDTILVVDKRAGLVVHPAPGHPEGTLVNGVIHHLGAAAAAHLTVLPGNGPERPGVVHRLDRDTSGLLVMAKTDAALRSLADQFRAHRVERIYVAVVEGIPPWETRRVETAHGRDVRYRRRFSPDVVSERRAVTVASRRMELRDASVLTFALETGRTHQIRMHMRHVGHPILGDVLYGRKPRQPRVRDAVRDLDRHALHAMTLGFEHLDGTWRRFSSGLPAGLRALIDELEGDPDDVAISAAGL